MRGLTWLLLMWLVLVALPASAQTRAWLDRPEITDGETVALNIQTDQAVAQIDFSPLQQVFDLGGQTVRRSFELVNGQSSTTSVFSVGLRPRAPGILIVPALRVGNATTAALRLVVLPPAVQPATAKADVFVETEVDATQPYVQQSVGVTVRLNYAVPLLSGQLDLEAPEHASLQRVGEDIQYQRMLGGRRYSVVERRFLLIPERSGPLLLPGARLNGITGGGFTGQFFEDDRQQVSAAAPSRTLQVLSIPVGAPQPWLPLHSLQLRYLQAPKQAWAGQAATVEIEMVADGATAAQVPALNFPAVSGMQVFAEPPQIMEQFVNGRPRTTVRRTVALVPVQAGVLSAPGPRIVWWDAEHHVARASTLPPLQLQVAAGARMDAPSTVPPVTKAAPVDVSPDGGLPVHPVWQRHLREWALAAGVLAVLGIIGWWWSRTTSSRVVTTPAPASAAALRDALSKALDAGDLARIGSALVAAARVAVDDLDAVRAHLADAAQQEAVERLQAARWGRGDAQMAVRALRAAFAGGARWRETKQQAHSLLPPLYPE